MAVEPPELEELQDNGQKIGLTVYLLKPDKVATFENELKPGREVRLLAPPLAGEFIVFPTAIREPPWVGVVRSALLDSAGFELKAQSPAGLLVVKREEDTFVVSFGHAWGKLQEPWLEADFGLRVALNSIPPDKIIEIRSEQVLAKWHVAVERAPRASVLHEFGVEFDRDLVAALGGVPSRAAVFGSHVRGGTNMHLEASFTNLGDVLDKAATLFRSNAYKRRWPEVGNINPVTDPAVVEQLDARLDADFESGDAQRKLVLFTPVHRHNEELPLARSYVYGHMLKDPPFRPYLLAEFWMNFLAEKNRLPSTAEAKKDRLHLLDESREEIKNYRIYDCFGYELSFGGKPYILSSGVWYEIVSDFLKRINKYIATQIKTPEFQLPRWDQVEDEAAYNARCGALRGFLLFDTKNVQFGGGHSKLEFCDFLDTRTKTLYFAKIASRSSGMSHLVEQVRRSTELLFDTDQAYRNELSRVFEKQHPRADRAWLKSRPQNWDWKLCLVSLGRPARDLPFFAKCALWKLHRNLTARGHEVFYVSV
jgi:uncharacterized protein (TIGR04141 family)